jgi:hypothetical protein
MDKNLKDLIDIYKQKRYSEIENISPDRMLKVDSKEVTNMTKKNQSYLICTCESSGKTGHNSLCRHKKFFINYPVMKLFFEELNNKISLFESLKYSKDMNKSFEIAIKELKEFRLQ